MDKIEFKEVIAALRRILQEIQTLKDDLKGEFVSREAFNIQWEVVNKDLNNLGNKIRDLEAWVKQLDKHNQEQDIKSTALATKIATILGILGGLGGVGALILYLIKSAVGG